MRFLGEWTENFGWFSKFLIGAGILFVSTLILLGLMRTSLFTFVDNYQFGYVYEYWTGKQYEVGHNGYIFSPFWLRAVHTIDMRPMQVSISSIQRVLNAKLVHFDPQAVDKETNLKGWELFIKWHGRNDYEGPGTAGSTTNTSGDFKDILTNYAYDGTGRSYSFLVIEKELRGEGVMFAPKPTEAKQ